MVSSSYEKSLARSVSTLWARHRLVYSFDTCRVNSRSWLGKRPFCTSCAAMELAVTGHFPVCNVDLQVSLFSVWHALRLEWIKSIDGTISFHLCRRFSSKTLSSDVAVDADSVFSESICSLYSCSHSSTVNSEVVIYTAEWTEASWREWKCPCFEKGVLTRALDCERVILPVSYCVPRWQNWQRYLHKWSTTM